MDSLALPSPFFENVATFERSPQPFRISLCCHTERVGDVSPPKPLHLAGELVELALSSSSRMTARRRANSSSSSSSNSIAASVSGRC